MPATVLSNYVVPDNERPEFLDAWRKTRRASVRDAGLIESYLHGNTGVGNPTFDFIEIARWRDDQAWLTSGTGTRQLTNQTVSHSSIFECVVDVIGQENQDAPEPASLLNTFIVPEGEEEEFLRRWKTTTGVFSQRPGFMETHLHRNAGTGDTVYRFLNIAHWVDGEAWRSNHSDYRPTEYDIPGVKGHAAIFAIKDFARDEPAIADLRTCPFINTGFFDAKAST